MSAAMAALEDEMRRYALGFPEAIEDHPWDHVAIKVRKKNFVFLGGHKDAEGLFSMTVKLPQSAEMVVNLPFVEPSGYGLGRAGWVTVKLSEGDDAEPEMLKEWIEQSYRAVAPKTLVKQLDAAGS